MTTTPSAVKATTKEAASPAWTALVYFMTGRFWLAPIAVTVTTALPHVAASRAVQEAKRRLKPRARIVEVKVTLQRVRTVGAE